MNILIDACSIINLYNGQCLERITDLAGKTFWIGPLVLGECNADCAKKVLALIKDEKLCRLSDDEVSAERYLELIEQFGLGPGETECLTAAESKDYMICTDDHLARRAAIDLFGRERLIGSARLLRWLVECKSAECGEANEFFSLMKQEGGYLPRLEATFFCEP